jgi:hypothetical protein
MKKMLPPEQILERAEVFFAKQNFPLAKKLFEEYPYGLLHPEVTAKIEQCNSEIAKARANTLLKKSKKLLKKGKKTEAFELLKEAFELSGDETIKQRLDVMTEHQQTARVYQNAEQAEIASNHSLAAELYKKLFTAEPESAILVKLLFNTVLADAGIRKAKHLLKKYADKLTNCSDFNAKQLYQLGYVYCKVNNFAATIQLWNKIDRQDSPFVEQKDAVLALWEQHLFKKSRSIKPFATLATEAETFLTYTSSKTVTALLQREKFKQAEVLFKQQQYRSALKLLLPFPEKMDAEQIRFYAGIYYHIVKYANDVSGAEIVSLCELCQNIVYNPQLSGMNYKTMAELNNAEQKNRYELIKLNNKYKVFIEYYLTMLNDALQNIQKVFSTQKNSEYLLTPRIAMLMGKSNQVATAYAELSATAKVSSDGMAQFVGLPLLYCDEIQDAIYCSFDNPTHIAENQYLITAGKGNNLLKQLYLDLAVLAYSKDDALRFEQYLLKAADRFYADDMLDFMLKVLVPTELELPYLLAIDKAIAPIMKKSKNKLLYEKCSKYSLSKIMLQHEVESKKTAVLRDELIKILTKLNMDIPEEFVAIFEDAEIEEIANLIGHKNIQQASKIAQETEFEDVQEFFFIQISEIMQGIVTMDDQELTLTVATKLYPHCYSVDPEHEITRMLGKSTNASLW